MMNCNCLFTPARSCTDWIRKDVYKVDLYYYVLTKLFSRTLSAESTPLKCNKFKSLLGITWESRPLKKEIWEREARFFQQFHIRAVFSYMGLMVGFGVGFIIFALKNAQSPNLGAYLGIYSFAMGVLAVLALNSIYLSAGYGNILENSSSNSSIQV